MNNEDFFEEVSTACLRNDKQYIKDGEILCSFRSYSHALAMTILGNVELGKSTIYNLCSKKLIPKKICLSPIQHIFKIEKWVSSQKNHGGLA